MCWKGFSCWTSLIPNAITLVFFSTYQQQKWTTILLASQQTFGTSYSVRVLRSRKILGDTLVLEDGQLSSNANVPGFQLGHHRRLRTHDGYFPNSLRPISYLGYIWVMPEKQSFFYKKLNNGNHAQGTHSHSSKIGADISTENTPNTPQFILHIAQ